jgi:hypothetical protein
MFHTAAANLAKFALFLTLVAGGTVGVLVYERRQTAAFQIQKLEQERQKLEEQKRELQAVVQHLSDEKRVAEILVRDQKPIDGIMRTTLLFVEYAKDGSALPAKTFTIDGNTAHIDAMVIKFDRDFVANNDPLRGHSIALFHRLFGEAQSPEHAFSIDEPGKIPDIYRGDGDPSAQRAFEYNLWQNFWRLAEDKEYRIEKGVRVANGQGVWGPFSQDKLYTLTLDADGGLNLTSEPMKGIYREAMKQNVSKGE